MINLIGHPYQRLIEPQAGLHADHQHIQHVRQGQLHLLLPSLEPAPDEERGADPSDGTQPDESQHHLGSACPYERQNQQAGDGQAEGQSNPGCPIDRHRVGVGVARLKQKATYLGGVLPAPFQPLSQYLQHILQSLGPGLTPASRNSLARIGIAPLHLIQASHHGALAGSKRINVRANNATVSAVRMKIMASMRVSDLDIDDLADPEESDQLHRDSHPDQDLADRVGEENRHVLGFSM